MFIDFYSIIFLLQKNRSYFFSRKHETYIIGKLLGLKRQRGDHQKLHAIHVGEGVSSFVYGM